MAQYVAPWSCFPGPPLPRLAWYRLCEPRSATSLTVFAMSPHHPHGHLHPPYCFVIVGGPFTLWCGPPQYQYQWPEGAADTSLLMRRRPGMPVVHGHSCWPVVGVPGAVYLCAALPEPRTCSWRSHFITLSSIVCRSFSGSLSTPFHFTLALRASLQKNGRSTVSTDVFNTSPSPTFHWNPGTNPPASWLGVIYYDILSFYIWLEHDCSSLRVGCYDILSFHIWLDNDCPSLRVAPLGNVC